MKILALETTAAVCFERTWPQAQMTAFCLVKPRAARQTCLWLLGEGGLLFYTGGTTDNYFHSSR